ncbi:MAG: glycoside hydrolase family 75 protein [Terrimicrobiaceae bacterium]|nr:glycoside hydrolase family 75 protein [Terrimicrobiaceae bacterium]
MENSTRGVLASHGLRVPASPRLPVEFLLLFLLVLLSACKPPAPAPTPHPTATPKPPPTPTPIPVIDRKRMEVSMLFSDLQVTSRVEAIRSPATASQDRTQPGSYRLELTLHADVPEPSRTLEQITRNDATLPSALAGLAARLATARVSPAFEQIYALKLDYLKSRLARIDALLSLHNLYDCETILEFENPANGCRALFIQGDMDVNTDGSDGDRNFPIATATQFYQPQTSFRWKRLTKRPNPFLEPVTRKLADCQEELSHPGLPAARRAELRDAIADARATLYEIQRYSFLIAGADPFIVLPAFMLRGAPGPFTPAIGDYAVVVHNGVAYPALVGDAGPSYKFGEASARLCKQVNPASTANSRPVSSLKVTYLVFPGSKDATPGPPDLEKWHTRCAELLAALDLKPAALHAWENLIRPWPTPTPPPTPTPAPSPTNSPSPSPATPPVPAA